MAEDNETQSAPVALDGRIEQAKQQLERMIDLTPQTMLLMSGEGAVIRTNRSLLDLLGLEKYSQILGKRLPELFACEAADFFDELLSADGGYVTRETNVKLVEGRTRSLQFKIVGGDQREGAYVIIVRDTTEEKKESVRVEQSFKHEAVQALMGALMHHLNQPLTVISVRARLMQLALEKGQAEPDELKKTLQDIMDLTVQMAAILKKVEGSTHFETESYVEGLEILDIEE